MTPILGGEETAVPLLMHRVYIIMKDWPPAKRTLTELDVDYDDDPEDAHTDTWYDWVTPALLTKGDGSAEIMAQFKNCTPGCYYKGDDGA